MTSFCQHRSGVFDPLSHVVFFLLLIKAQRLHVFLLLCLVFVFCFFWVGGRHIPQECQVVGKWVFLPDHSLLDWSSTQPRGSVLPSYLTHSLGEILIHIFLKGICAKMKCGKPDRNSKIVRRLLFSIC